MSQLHIAFIVICNWFNHDKKLPRETGITSSLLYLREVRLTCRKCKNLGRLRNQHNEQSNCPAISYMFSIGTVSCHAFFLSRASLHRNEQPVSMRNNKTYRALICEYDPLASYVYSRITGSKPPPVVAILPESNPLSPLKVHYPSLAIEVGRVALARNSKHE